MREGTVSKIDVVSEKRERERKTEYRHTEQVKDKDVERKKETERCSERNTTE